MYFSLEEGKYLSQCSVYLMSLSPNSLFESIQHPGKLVLSIKYYNLVTNDAFTARLLYRPF